MRKLLLALSLFVFTSSFTINKKGDNVYICNSTTAVAYHSSESCSGLNRCTHGFAEACQNNERVGRGGMLRPY